MTRLRSPGLGGQASYAEASAATGVERGPSFALRATWTCGFGCVAHSSLPNLSKQTQGHSAAFD
jgi:hypothetical protein